MRTVAAALARVATGASFRSTAALVRDQAGRTRLAPQRQRGRKFTDPNRHGQLISDWVAVFAPVIWQAYAPTVWPPRLILDESGFRASAAQPAARGTPLFSVLGAVGYPYPGARPVVWRLEAVPAANTAAWQGFLTALAGRAEALVTDGGSAIARAVTAAWPGEPAPRLRRCEWHLRRGLAQSLPEPIRDDATHPVTKAMTGCLTSTTNWARFENTLHQFTQEASLPGTWSWVERNRELILTQAVDRDGFGPHSIGPLEEVFRHVDNVLDDRVYTMTNKARTDRLLMLIAADRNGWVDERAWAEIIRDHLHGRDGLADRQRQVNDPVTTPSLR
ncbi:hypothetical protein [Kutzneria buriramensis]|uniref:Mutator family transposase n=1 Tax=Kutzneria buriramensis TaxID=1045776 RepID=A0A3E0I917_9PSEU|nr:hypothetical protein [Kutzneria buriramensis]REH55222.1 hypothetical protein BCF44_101239 [Kutzneria buriramensis]